MNPRNRRIASATAIGGLATGCLLAAPTIASAQTQPSPLIKDSFSRTIASGSGWGSAETGGDYSVGEKRDVSTNGSVGVMSLASAVAREAFISARSTADLTTQATFGVSALPTAGSVYASVESRRASDGSRYETRLRVMPDKTIRLNLRHIASNGNVTTLTNDSILDTAMTASTRIVVKLQNEGSTLRVKAWPSTTTEPSAWTQTATSNLQPNAGDVGIYGYLGSGTNSLSLYVDDFSATPVLGPNVAPTASFTSSANDLTLNVDASGSTDSDGTVSKYAWNFGDGSTATGKTASHTYAKGGTYSVVLTVTDDDGATATKTSSVTVVAPNVLPNAAFTTSQNDLTTSVDASGSSDSDGTITAYAWDFGDGSTGTGKTATHAYSKAGTYTVKLTVTDDRAGTATTSKQVTAIAPNVLPNAAFTTSQNDLTTSVDASDSNDPDGTITAYAWDFGDGSTATGKTASHTYAKAGNYTITLTVTDNRNGKAATTKQATAIAPNVLPNAAFTTSQNDLTTSVDASDSNDPDGTITAYAWDFGDGSTGTGKTATHAYAKAGNYTITLTVTDNRNGKATLTKQVTAIAPNVLPNAAFTSSQNDLTTSVDASNSNDPDGTITAYAWDFGDGSTATGKTATHAYAKAGNYTVKLTVTDNRDGKASTTKQVTVIAPNVLPTSSFTFGTADLKATFDGSNSSDSDGTIANYAWDFGDGSTATGKTTSRTYAKAGTYTVTLTVTDDRGGKATSTASVTVVAPNQAPTSSFTFTTSKLKATFDGSGSNDPDGTIASYAWDFGDGSTATDKTPTHTYTAAGTYTVKLTVTDNQGAKASSSAAVTVVAPSTRPDATNTGVPEGTNLKVVNGNVTVTTAGTVIDGQDIHGYVNIKAANVTIRNSIIRGGAPITSGQNGLLSIVSAGATNFLIEDSTLVPEYPNVRGNGVYVNQNATFNRVDISGTVDGMVIYGNGVTVKNSYIHDLVHYASDPAQGGGASHDDAIQMQGGIGVQILNNTLLGGWNSAVQITQDAGTVRDLWINNNYIDGGGCSLNYASNGAYKTGMQANNNRFGRNQRVSGCAIIHNSAVSDLNPTGNVWDDNGTAAGIKKGA